MRRIGKTLAQVLTIKDSCKEGKTILIVGLQDPKQYLETLGEGYVAEPTYKNKILTGYIFKQWK